MEVLVQDGDGQVGAMSKLAMVKIEHFLIGTMVDDAIGRDLKIFFINPVFGHGIEVEEGNGLGSIQNKA